MLETYDKNERNRKKVEISSGETELLEGMQAEWHKLYAPPVGKDTDNRSRMKEYAKWTYEDVTERDPRPFLEAVKEIKVIPAYRYVINYLLLKTKLGLGEENKKGFIAFVAGRKFQDLPERGQDMEKKRMQLLGCENGQEQKKLTEENFQDLWEIFIYGLEQLFLENGYEERIDWIAFFSGLLESFRYKSLKILALGVHMSVEELNIFLTKVLKRSYINFYDRDEIFVYLALKYADKAGLGTYQAYRRLYDLYPMEEIKENPDWKEDKDSISTLYLEQKLENILVRTGSSLFEETDKNLERYLAGAAWENEQPSKKDHMRTAQKRFLNLWKKLLSRWEDSDEMIESIRIEKEERKKTRKNCRDEAVFHKELTVVYDPKTGCELPAGTEFRAETSRASGKGSRTAVFRLPQEQIFLPEETEVVEVFVKAMMSEKEFEAKKQDLPKVNEFVPKKDIEFPKMKVDTEKLVNRIEEIQIKTGVRFFDNGKKANRGTLLVKCKIGTFIPEGSKFSFELEGVRFCYESLKHANIYKIRIPVRPLKKWDKQWESARLNKKAYIEKKSEFKVCQDGKESVRGICAVFAGKSEDICFFAEGQKKNYITAICEKTCRIPKGTIFEYWYREKKFCFESTEEVERWPRAVGKIQAVWENVEEFQEKAREKKYTFLPANAQLSFQGENLNNIYEIYAEKGTALEPSTERDGDAEEGTALELSVEQDEKNKKYEISDSWLFRKIYGTSDEKNADCNGYYKGIPGYEDDYFLNSKLFKESRIVRGYLKRPPMDEERLRNLILTLKFWEYLWWGGGVEHYEADESKELLGDFADGTWQENFLKDNGTDEELMACGFYTFSTSFPYDAFLALLLNSDEPDALFQAVWSDRPQLIKGKENE